MTTYIVMLIIAVITARFCEKTKFQGRNNGIAIKTLLIGIPFAVVSGFRANTIGIDYQAYTVSYFVTGFKNTGRSYEFLAELVNNIARTLNSPSFIIGFYTITTCFGIAYWIIKKSKKLVMPVILFFITGTFNWSLNIMRQTLAMVIVFIAIDLIERESPKIKDKLIFSAIVLIAGMFHMTAIMYLLLVFVPYSFFRDKFKAFCIAIIALPLASSALRTGIMAISQRFNFYYRYFNNYYDQATYTGSLIFVTTVCLLLVIMTYKKWRLLNKNYSIGALIIYVGVATSLIGNVIPNNARVTFLFYPYTIVMLPQFLTLVRKKYRKYVKIGIIICLIAFYISSFVINNWGETVPYRWVFQ